ncbi:MAG: glucosyl-3-phosphoglycerate synthase [Solirubrobacterales bacterium]|nr:glucosyl-3-phosphoglycerate synthase [Solirubrobacterales bacterium]
MSLRARTWEQEHTHHHGDFSAAPQAGNVSVCLPARNEQHTIGPIVEALAPLLQQGVIAQLVVVDDSEDRTAQIAAAAGAEVHRQTELMPELGPVLGKGDAMWRALSVLDGEVVVFLDADSTAVGPHYVTGLLGPLTEPRIQLVKGFYRRPFKVGGVTLPEGGGRVTELTARPLLKRFFPELAHVRQPLAGEIAARRSLLETLPFTTGYGVDVALLLDTYIELGLDGIAQVDLDVRQNSHQALADLGPMADAVLGVVMERAQRDGRLAAPVSEPLPERPAVACLREAA